MSKLGMRILPIGMFLVIAVFLAIGLTRDPSLIPTEMIDRPLPDFELQELRDEDQIIGDEDLLGQTALVNVFGSWCVACLEEHPTLMRVASDEDVRLVGVNWRDKQADALAWLVEHGNPYDLIIADTQSTLAIELGVTGAPETFIVDSSGRIRFKQVGPITPEVWRDTIQPVLIQIEAEASQGS